MFEKILKVIDKIDANSISEERKSELDQLVAYIQEKIVTRRPINLNFICTHNSRRSQFSQIWAKVASVYHGVPIHSYSGGVEVTACNERTIASLERFGFQITKPNESNNPQYHVHFADNEEPIIAFSKLFDDRDQNPSENFAAIMTCSHADENCPFVPGVDRRIPIRYEDLKTFDDTPLEIAM